MLVIIGYIVVLGAVLGGYALTGGHLGVLYQPAEFIIIFGAGIGAFLASTNGKGVSASIRVLPQLMRGSQYSRQTCLDLMTLLYLLMVKARRQGVMALEGDIDDPAQSELFSKYPDLQRNRLLMDFIIDYLRMMVSGNLDPFEIEALMDHEIDTFREEAEVPAKGFGTMAEGLPAFGIVAAVMGVVQALGTSTLDPENVGPLVAHAMIGTFLGILLAYGFVAPLAARIRTQIDDAVKVLQAIKVTLLAQLNGYAPQVAIEFGRKALFAAERPGFSELEDHMREVRIGRAEEAAP